MHLAVNTRFLIPETLEGFGHYSNEILSRMVLSHPGDRFDFYFDRKFSQSFLYAENVRGHTLYPQARHPVLFYVWYQLSLRRALRATKPDVFFSPGSFMPLGLECPSVITIHDVAHQPYPDAVSPATRKYYRMFMPKFIEKARRIITVSHFSKAEILKYYDVDASKIDVIYNGIGSEYRPLTDAAQKTVRARYTKGAPYFLFIGAIHPRKNVAGLIDAYSVFREKYGDDIKLVIAGRKSWDFADVDRAVQRSRFRQDIIFTGYVPMRDLAQLTASAFALCYISLYEGFGLPVAEAMRSGVPVIVTQNSAHSEVAGEAGLTVDAAYAEDVAEAMAKIAHDAALRAEMTTAGLERSKLFSWDVAARATYTSLQAAVS